MFLRIRVLTMLSLGSICLFVVRFLYIEDVGSGTSVCDGPVVPRCILIVVQNYFLCHYCSG